MKAIIADDERKICMLIRELIDWQALGIEIVDEAYSGTSAYEKIRRHKPEIVITDIRMPGMDGLEMIRRLKREKLDTEFIIISGHKNFEYAHTAIQFGVSNYLLKPLTATDLYDNVLDVSRRILRRRNKEDELERLHDRLDYSYQLIGKQFVSRFCSEPMMISSGSVEELNRKYCTAFVEGLFAVAQIHLKANQAMSLEQNNIMLEKVEMYFLKRLRSGTLNVASGQYEGKIVLVLNASSRSNMELELKDVLQEAQRYFSDFCMLAVGLSSCEKRLQAALLREAEIALCARLDFGMNRIIRYSECAASSAGEYLSSHLYRQLLDMIDLADVNKLQQWWKNEGKTLSSPSIPPTVVFRGAGNLINTLEAKFETAYKLSTGVIAADEIRASVRNAGTRNEISTQLLDWVSRCMEQYVGQLQEQGTPFVREAQLYISAHYAEDISLQDVADHVHLNSSYFSTLFKKKQGQGFNEYLVSYRIEMAKRLLAETNLSIANVGKQVGYADAAYFSKLFTKVVGIRPKDFRKLHI